MKVRTLVIAALLGVTALVTPVSAATAMPLPEIVSAAPTAPVAPSAQHLAHLHHRHHLHVLHMRLLAARAHAARAASMRTVGGKHYLSGAILSRYDKPPMVRTRWGVVPQNTYHGKWYDASALSTRNCIVRRESDGSPTSINSGGYSGLYQFGLSWTRTLQKYTGERVAIVRMSYQAQDLSFWRVWNFGRGASNWAGGRWSCPRV